MDSQILRIYTSESNNILQQQVSYQLNAWSSLSKEISISETLNEIKSGIHLNQVTNLRTLLQSGNRDGYNNHKKNLPAVTFCGTFEGKRKRVKLKSYNSVIVLDVDKLDDSEFNRVKECFLRDVNVFSFWDSPSKEGVKGLVYLNYTFELNEANIDIAHKGAFQKVSKYFKENYNIELDNSGSDTTRLCFFSYDSLLTLKDEIVGFDVNEVDILPIREPKESTNELKTVHVGNRNTLFNPKERNSPGDRYTIQAILKFLVTKNLSITYSYDEWYKVAMAIANTFTYDVGLKYFQKLSSMDKGKYNINNCTNFLQNSYLNRNGTITFSTIVFFANEKGYITKKQRDRGSEVVDENLSQVSSSNTVLHLPEDLKK